VKWVTCLAATVVAAALGLASAAGGASRAAPPLPTLLARHVPILSLHPTERFGPVRVEGFLEDADVMRKTATGWEKTGGALPAGGADLRLDQRYCRAIEGVAASPCYVKAEAAHGSGPVVYGTAFRAKGRIDLQYWLWYPYNDFSPTVPPGDVWQVHEGDWEAVSVILDSSGRPLVAAYSQHGAGMRRDWAAVPKQGARPLVYVGVGSHANYFRPGKIPLDPRTFDPTAIRIIKAYGIAAIEHAGGGKTVKPRLIPVSAKSPQWMTFAGVWGETGYIHFPQREPPIETGAGPRGPAFHEQWQQPVAEAMSWPKG
jgi:hypothetical protein